MAKSTILNHNAAINLLYERGVQTDKAIYKGYGSCPRTVERGKVILAEFGYGGNGARQLMTILKSI